MSLRGFIGETGWRGLYRGAFQAARSALIDGKCRAGDRKCWPAIGCSPDTMPGAMSVSTRPPPRFPTPNTEPIEVLISGQSTVHSTICLWVTASGCGVLPLGARSHRVLMQSFTTISSCCAKRVALKMLGSATTSKPIRYRTFVNPQDIEQILAPALDHFFNHQTHHRGQAHALVSRILGNNRTPSFDLIIYQRETGNVRIIP